MAIFLKRSVFIHIPKCGGRWVKKMIEDHIPEFSYSGDPVYDAHDRPATPHHTPFCFVREPAMLAHSLWHHRARKKQNTRGHQFNWQDDVRLERECQSKDYLQFMLNVANNQNAVSDYFMDYIDPYENILVGKLENIGADLITFLQLGDEVADYAKIQECSYWKVGQGPQDDAIDPHVRAAINRANEEFSAKFGYV